MDLPPPFVPRPEWYDRASCRGTGPDLFFLDKGVAVGEAIAVCRGCTVRVECLMLALERPETHGIWGGYPQRQLRVMRARRAS